MAAILVGEYFGITKKLIKKGIKGYNPKNKRSQIITTSTNKIFLDAYNANPSSMEAALIHFSSSNENLIFICGHYKGIDERVVEKYVTHEYSLGDYVISNGELSTLVIIDSIVRLMPGVLNDISSAQTDSFYNNLLDAPYYTNPKELDGMKVPDVLLSGDHKKIKSWKNKNRKAKTMINRPDLWNRYINENKSEIRNE